MAWDALMTYAETNVSATKNSSTIDLVATSMQLHGRLDVTAITGTTPTLTVKFQDSDDGSAWADLVQLPQITAVTSDLKFALRTKKRYLRYVMTIGGTTPSVSMTLRLK
jgi:hypothetical protein